MRVWFEPNIRNSEVIFLLLIWVPSHRSQVRRFRIKLSLAERIVPYLFQFERKLLIGTSITKAKRSQRSQTKQILTAILSGGDGFYRDSRKNRWSIRNWSRYAYGDSPYAYEEEGQKFHIWGVPVCITKLCAYWEQHIPCSMGNSYTEYPPPQWLKYHRYFHWNRYVHMRNLDRTTERSNCQRPRVRRLSH